MKQILVAAYIWEGEFQFSNVDPDSMYSEKFQTISPMNDGDRSETIHILKYGSEPCRTYLPDSDIDLTIINSGKFKKND